MTIVVEYRVPMPFSAAEYRIGQLYTIAKKSQMESSASGASADSTKDSNNDGNSQSAVSLTSVQINANEPYQNGPGGSGQYTNKTYFLANRIPDCLRRLLPESAGKLNEEAWNAYPYSRNKFTCPMLDKLQLEIESRYLEGPPTEANVFELGPKEERKRSIVVLDLAKDKYKTRSSTCNEREVLTFMPRNRPSLTENWLQDYEMAREQGEENHLMTCYKLCRISFPVWALENKVEQFILNFCRDTIVETHRQTWLWQDEWIGMSLEEIRMMEKATQRHLNELARSRQSSIAN